MAAGKDCGHTGGGKVLFLARDYISGLNFAVRKCAHCHLSFTDLSYAEQKVTSERFYPADYYGSGSRYPQALQKFVNFLVMRRATLLGDEAKSRSGAVLDIGCGQGAFLKHFADRGWRAVGTEVDSRAAFHAREVLGLDVLVGERATRQLEENSFDIVCLWHVLEHVAEPKALLCGIRRLLRDNGKLLLSVPNFSSFEARVGRQNWFHLDVPRHITHFSEERLQAILEETGWVVTKKTYFTPEYDFFSFIQTAQNMCGLDMNLLYRTLRHGELSALAAEKTSAVQRFMVFVTLPLFAFFSLAYVPIVNILQRGSSVNLILKKKTC
jgi:2-polyprenyl-3-methyl-5-hydroxy-6-metoxy-1,4-benzoquinol methylase